MLHSLLNICLCIKEMSQPSTEYWPRFEVACPYSTIFLDLLRANFSCSDIISVWQYEVYRSCLFIFAIIESTSKLFLDQKCKNQYSTINTMNKCGTLVGSYLDLFSIISVLLAHCVSGTLLLRPLVFFLFQHQISWPSINQEMSNCAIYWIQALLSE